MAESALCGPANPLQAFQKHVSDDPAFRQARFAREHLHPNGFPSSDAQNAGLLDGEFEAFQAGLTQPPPEPYHGAEMLPMHAQPSPAPAPLANWAAEFQRLQLSDAQPSDPQPASDGMLQATRWHHSFLQKPEGEQRQRFNPEQVAGMPSPYGYPSLPDWDQVGLPPQALLDPVFDDEAFERAFDAVMEESALEQDTHSLVESTSTSQHFDYVDPAARQERIGADTIEAGMQKLDGDPGDADELARTAGMLLDRVGDNQSAKFQNSSFLALMRRVRDREVMVRGDKMVDVSTRGGEPVP